jgi:hypothetical protein
MLAAKFKLLKAVKLCTNFDKIKNEEIWKKYKL